MMSDVATAGTEPGISATTPAIATGAASTEVQRMALAVSAWARERWPGCRVLRELVLGGRRIDLLAVGEREMVGIEIKSGADTLTRLEAQMAEYQRYVPEVWLAHAPRWEQYVQHLRFNRAVVTSDGIVRVVGDIRARPGALGRPPRRDELAISRLLELLWREEAARIAERTGTIPGCVRHRQMTAPKIKAVLARLLTGNDILAQCCIELRARPRGGTGIGSDPPVRATDPAAAALKKLSNIGDRE